VPEALFQMLIVPDAGRAQRAMGAMLQMKKLDVAALKSAYNGSTKGA
jgi:hypothetical protein